ncbi:uncharacterized protein CC84DRAFT_1205311 [Paraphaeosphaeria sporulosa]|uniref:Uncharacterized protein n=1 Tax=Paraphaeosphaeria sporulosa TaxID=1460663 RepID=A0A177CD14_9PLEO|nr:uncharacterized protein CC84DRAFT_1205311 [Paraphaeosphaeria sporulosa]OAG05533.1 hypothetical protein CC84DRAFT_1205311 [Paraphaeosphaeria sporulosa]
MAKFNTKSKAKSTNRCTCDPNDLLFEECLCGQSQDQHQSSTSGVREDWINDYTTLLDDNAAETNNNSVAPAGEDAGSNNSTENADRESSIGFGSHDEQHTSRSNDAQIREGVQHTVYDRHTPGEEEFQQFMDEHEEQQRGLASSPFFEEYRRTYSSDNTLNGVDVGSLDFTQERADLNNAMNTSSGLGTFDNFNDFGNELFPSVTTSMCGIAEPMSTNYSNTMNPSSFFGDSGNFPLGITGIFSTTDSSMQPISPVAQNPAPMAFENMDFVDVNYFDPNVNPFIGATIGNHSDVNTFGNRPEIATFDNGPNTKNSAISSQMPVSAQSGTTSSNANRAPVDRPQNQPNVSGHGIRKARPNAPRRAMPPSRLSAFVPIDQPQMLAALDKQNQQQTQDDAFERDRAMARANVRTAREAGQDLFGIHQQTQQSAQRFSTPTTPVATADPTTQRVSINKIGGNTTIEYFDFSYPGNRFGNQSGLQQPVSSPVERAQLSTHHLGNQTAQQRQSSTPFNQFGDQPVQQRPPTPSTERTPLSANQLGKQPVRQPSSSSPAEPTPSKKRARPADIQIPDSAPKRVRPSAPPRLTATPAPVRPPFADEVEAAVELRGRMVSELLKTKWLDMTVTEKARILLPICQGKHPLQFEKEELERGLTYGATRQREALHKAAKLNDVAVKEAQAIINTRAATAAEQPPVQTEDMDEDDELAALKARMAEIEAKKKAKLAEEKAQAVRDKRAAAQRRKREAEREARKKAAQDVAQLKQREEVEEQQRLPEEQFHFQQPYAHMGFYAAQSFQG